MLPHSQSLTYDVTNRESLKQRKGNSYGRSPFLCYRTYPIWHLASLPDFICHMITQDNIAVLSKMGKLYCLYPYVLTDIVLSLGLILSLALTLWLHKAGKGGKNYYIIFLSHGLVNPIIINYGCLKLCKYSAEPEGSWLLPNFLKFCGFLLQWRGVN